MRELDVIVDQYNTLKNAKTESVLATVVHVEGSSYRRAGARMLIDEYGTITGAISGGCLEGDALRKALLALNQKRNKLVTYDTSDEDDAIIGAQLGCNGIIQVLFEPLDYTDRANPCELLATVNFQKAASAIVVQFNLDRNKEQPGTRLCINENSEYTGIRPDEALWNVILRQAQFSLKNQENGFAELDLSDEKYYAFIQNYQPPVKLVIVGAGNDAQILAAQADLLGWEVVVTDGRPTHANKERFVSSCTVIVTKPEETLSNVSIDQRTCFALMSHNYNYDLAVLKLLLLEDDIPYIGILGPLKKYQRMQDDLKKEGFELTNKIGNKIHAPIGLEIGAETPAEIGLSILAEIQSVLTNTGARPLKFKTEAIHEKKKNQFRRVAID